jgi:hypothetical protein
MSGLWSGSPGLWSGNLGLWGGYTGLSGGGGLWGAFGGFSPATLFAMGEQGYWLDPSDFSTMFQDSAGTTPVTAAGQSVGRILDKSGRGNHFIQSSLASRPLLQQDIIRGLDLTPTYWVSPTGNDANAGTSEGAAWKSLSKAASVVYGASSASPIVVRVKAGTYNTSLDYFDVTTAASVSNPGLIMVHEPGCIMDGTAAVAAVNRNGYEFSTGANWPVTIYGNGLLIRNYANSFGSANGVGNRGSNICDVYDVTVDNCDDGLSGHSNSILRAYDCTFRNCVKSAYAHVDNTETYHYRCRFEGRSASIIGIGTNQSTKSAYFEGCLFIPATSGQVVGFRNSIAVQCQIGTTTLRVGGTESNNFVATDCFINFARDTNQVMNFQRCYGFASFRQRNGGSLTMENCVITGPATGLTNIFYSNFNPGSGSPHIIRNNIFETATAAAFMSYDATNAGYLVAAGSQFWNNVLGGSAAFDADLIAADTLGTVIQNNVTADPLIGAGNTLNPADYGYAAGSPAIGTGVGGTNSGFAVGEVSAPVAMGTGAPKGPLYLLFDGSDDFLVSAATINPGAVDKAQVFAGVRKLSDAARGMIAELSVNAGINAGSFLLDGPGITPASESYRYVSNGTATVIVSAGGVYPAPITNVITSTSDISGDSAILRINGTQAASSTADQGTGNYLAYLHYIGRRGGTSLPFNGRIYQMITRFGPNLTSDVITQSEAFVAQRTGFTAPDIQGVPTIS